MSEMNDPKTWAKYAEEDWEVANLLFKQKKALNTPICFHAQQSAEKYLKALLISKAANFPKTHDLLTLNSLCTKAGVLTEFSPEALTILTDHAVASRYPGEEPTREEAKESLKIAKAVRKFARAFLGI